MKQEGILSRCCQKLDWRQDLIHRGSVLELLQQVHFSTTGIFSKFCVHVLQGNFLDVLAELFEVLWGVLESQVKTIGLVVESYQEVHGTRVVTLSSQQLANLNPSLTKLYQVQ